MIRIKEKQNCCGCGACAQACPKHCIAMKADSEGFLYPVVDESLCIDCGLCERVCHELHPMDERKPLKVLAAINKDEEIRLKSSSGGIFFILAKQVIDEGGVVFGARFDEQWQVVIDYAEDIDGVKAFMGSKYVQARTETAFTDAKRFLTEGRKVLFSGTPCQIAGLHHFLRKQYDNLLTVDIICHGTPSPMVWDRYLNEVATAGKKAVCDVQFRNKENGWIRFNFSMLYRQDDKSISLCSHNRKNHYMRAFLSDLILRPSCYYCRAKKGRSHSDITLADFWGIDTVMPEMNDGKGTGLVLVNTDKGATKIDWHKITLRISSEDIALKYNPAYYHSAKPHPKRNEFFSRILDTNSMILLVNECLKPSMKMRINMLACSFRRHVHQMFHPNGGGNLNSYIETVSPLSFLDNKVSIIAISFRNKQNGWKTYNIVITLKGDI